MKLAMKRTGIGLEPIWPHLSPSFSATRGRHDRIRFIDKPAYFVRFQQRRPIQIAESCRRGISSPSIYRFVANRL
jgi:hypothetical protein